MNPTQRTQLLAVVAVGMVGFALLRGRATEDPGSSVVTPIRGPRDVAAVTSTAARVSGPLAERYRPILDANPFHAFSFKREPPRPTRRDPTPRESTPAPTPTPASTVALRLTGVVVDTRGTCALLEDRVHGKALLLHQGDKIGHRSVVEVRTDAIVFMGDIARPSSATTTHNLGDKLEVPLDSVESLLAPVGPPAPPKDAKGQALPVLSEPEKMSLIEKLKARRKASLGEARGDDKVETKGEEKPQ